MQSRRIVSLLLAAGLSLPIAMAQDTKPASRPEVKQPSASAPVTPPTNPRGAMRNSREEDDGLVSLDFAGGTVGQYIDALRKAVDPRPFNVFLDPEAAAVKAPPMKLSNASLLNSLRVLARSGATADGRWLNLAVENLESQVAGGSPTYVIRANYMEGPMGPNQGPRSAFVVLSLNPIVGLPGTKKDSSSALDAKAVLSAVEAAIVVADSTGTEAPVLKFHEASGLLFVRGTPTQQRAASDVINQLRKDVEHQKDAVDAERPKQSENPGSNEKTQTGGNK